MNSDNSKSARASFLLRPNVYPRKSKMFNVKYGCASFLGFIEVITLLLVLISTLTELFAISVLFPHKLKFDIKNCYDVENFIIYHIFFPVPAHRSIYPLMVAVDICLIPIT